MTKFAATLRSARLDRALSLRDIQKLSDNKITSSYVHNIENRGLIPSPKKLRVLAKILKLDFISMMIMAGHVQAADLGAGAK